MYNAHQTQNGGIKQSTQKQITTEAEAEGAIGSALGGAIGTNPAPILVFIRVHSWFLNNNQK